jgi:hypothetical protein
MLAILLDPSPPIIAPTTTPASELPHTFSNAVGLLHPIKFVHSAGLGVRNT